MAKRTGHITPAILNLEKICKLKVLFTNYMAFGQEFMSAEEVIMVADEIVMEDDYELLVEIDEATPIELDGDNVQEFEDVFEPLEEATDPKAIDCI